MSKARRLHVTGREGDRIVQFVSDVLHTARMPRWTVLLMDKPAPKDCHAVIRPTDGRHVAELSVSRGWMKLDEQERCEVLVHEALHLVHRDLSDLIRVDLCASGYLPSKAYQLLWAGFRREQELMVDHLAAVFAECHQIRDRWDELGAKPRR